MNPKDCDAVKEKEKEKRAHERKIDIVEEWVTMREKGEKSWKKEKSNEKIHCFSLSFMKQ